MYVCIERWQNRSSDTAIRNLSYHFSSDIIKLFNSYVFQLVERNYVDRIFELFLLSMLDAKTFPFLGTLNRRMK